MALYVNLLFSILILGYKVNTQDFNFAKEYGDLFNDDALTGLQSDKFVPNEMFDKSTIHNNMAMLTESVKELRRRLEELLKLREQLMNQCDTVIASVQSIQVAVVTGTAATSNLVLTSDFASVLTDITKTTTTADTIASKKSTYDVNINQEISDDVKRLTDASKSINEKVAHIKDSLKQMMNHDAQNSGESIVCPYGFEMIKGHCYGLSALSATLSEGYAFCVAMGGYLVQAETQTERTDIAKFINRHGSATVFCGLTDVLNEGNWVWSWGGKALDENTFTNVWSPEQPDNWYYSEHAVDMVNWQGFTFNDLAWNNIYTIACEIGNI